MVATFVSNMKGIQSLVLLYLMQTVEIRYLFKTPTTNGERNSVS